MIFTLYIYQALQNDNKTNFRPNPNSCQTVKETGVALP